MLIFSAKMIIVLSILSQYLQVSAHVGRSCTYRSTNQAGVCELFQDCPPAKASLTTGPQFKIQICGFEGTVAAICCPSSSSPSSLANPPVVSPKPIVIRPFVGVPKQSLKQTTTSTTTSTEKPHLEGNNLNSSKTELKVGDKSRLKCHEYKKYVFSYPVLGGTLVDECKAKIGIPLIIGGEAAIGKEFPHMALIGYNGDNKTLWLCGGSLISERFVLTAGHCLEDKTYKEAAYVRLGDLVLDTDTDEQDLQDFQIIKRIKHPRYFTTSKYNDIGLLKLDKDATLNTFVRPACLDTFPEVNLAGKPIATGWGQTAFHGEASKILLKVTLEYFTEEECNMTYRDNIGIKLRHGITYERQICAGSHKEGKDACLGDSGGPLQTLSEENYCTYNVIGITSFGKTCGVANIPGVYTRVYNYIDWIENIVWP